MVARVFQLTMVVRRAGVATASGATKAAGVPGVAVLLRAWQGPRLAPKPFVQSPGLKIEAIFAKPSPALSANHESICVSDANGNWLILNMRRFEFKTCRGGDGGRIKFRVWPVDQFHFAYGSPGIDE